MIAISKDEREYFILTSHYIKQHESHDDGSRNFEPRSIDEDDIKTSTPLQLEDFEFNRFNEHQSLLHGWSSMVPDLSSLHSVREFLTITSRL
ncbi:hypothetical protein TNCV_2718411 [Trichonephila clavipes]|nr:hypothetical protein TNCV_2718411 [Trichonephila clavipes]